MVEIDITMISIAFMTLAGGLLGLKVYITSKDTGSKALKNKIKEMEDFEEYQKKQIRVYKNKVSNTERGPQIDGNLDELSSILPDLLGGFTDYLPKWAQPLLKDPESQKWIMEYIGKNPDKAKEWFGKIIGKKSGGSNAGTEDTLTI